MTAFNIVRMRVKPDREQEFLDINRNTSQESLDRMRMNGLRRAMIVKTGERSYCFLGEWENFDSIVKSRPEMISDLDRMRDTLEDLGSDLGVTDPVSGEVAVELNVRPATAARRSRAAPRRATTRKRRTTAKPARAAKPATRKPKATAKRSSRAKRPSTRGKTSRR